MPLDGIELAERSRQARQNRDDHIYTPDRDFSQPIVVRGTNRVLFQNDALTEIDKPSRDALNAVIEQCRAVDNDLRMIRIQNMGRLNIVGITPEALVLSTDVNGAEQHFVLKGPKFGGELPFSRFSSFLAIPFSFSSKNPTTLNSVNFDYYLALIRADKKKQTPVDIIHRATAAPVVLPAATEGGEPRTLQALEIVNMLKAPGRATEAEAPAVVTRIPFLSNILENTVAAITEADAGLTPVLQSYSLGYGGNKGRHFARILFDKEGLEFKFNGEPFKLGVTISTDYAGSAADFGTVNFGFSLFRQVCSNGMVVGLSTEARKEIIEHFVANELTKAGLQLGVATDDPEYLKVKLRAEQQGSVLFNPNGVKMAVGPANTGFDKQLIVSVLRFFLDAESIFQKQLAELQLEFGEVNKEDFISAALELSKAMKIKSPELIKFFLLEYVAGELTGKQIFKTPYDVVNYLTFLARAYDTGTQMDLEGKVVVFVTNLRHRLKEKQAEVSLFDTFAGQLSQQLLAQA